MQARLEETRASVEKQTRSLAVLQHSRQDVEHHMESLRREVAQERNVSSAAAVEASKAAQEATAMANRAVEASKELFQEQAEQKEQFLRQFEDWKLQVRSLRTSCCPMFFVSFAWFSDVFFVVVLFSRSKTIEIRC